VKIFYVPTTGPEDWQKHLALPEKQWRKGYSARTLAYCWESAQDFPPEVKKVFAESNNPTLHDLTLLLAIPEHKVILPPRGGHPSQNDLFVLAKAGDGNNVSITVEGKVSESFGERLDRWNKEESKGKIKRLNFIMDQLGLKDGIPPHVRYQLLHRTVSAVLEANRFNALYAVMLIHSFSQEDRGFDDYKAFLELFGVLSASKGFLYHLTETQGIQLFSGWVKGNDKYLEM